MPAPCRPQPIATTARLEPPSTRPAYATACGRGWQAGSWAWTVAPWGQVSQASQPFLRAYNVVLTQCTVVISPKMESLETGVVRLRVVL